MFDAAVLHYVHLPLMKSTQECVSNAIPKKLCDCQVVHALVYRSRALSVSLLMSVCHSYVCVQVADNGPKSYSLLAATRSMLQQYYYMTQLPSVFGFVSPMITYFALRITNWWIVFDIITGAAFLFIYMLLCAFHRSILNPGKSRI